MNDLWLPTGHHWDLHIEKKQLPNAGTFTGGGHKLVIHDTESPWMAVDAMYRVLRDKNAAPHFILGGRPGLEHPVVIQNIALNRAARALANNSADGYQTNRANAIQIEVCGYASDSKDWPVNRYEALANLVELIRHRFAIPLRAPDFSHPRRMTDAEFVAYEGIVGHSMVPDNDHTDPGHFREGRLINMLRDMPRAGYDL